MDEALSDLPILDGDLLRAFASFAVDCNFTLAARRIGLSQPALFERVQRLGDRVGRALYERSGRALALTDDGVRVAAFARDELRRARAFSDELAGTRRDLVVLAAGEGAYLYLLQPALARFLAKSSDGHGAGVVALTRGGPDALECVASGEAHLAVGVYDLVPKRMIAHDVVTTPLCAALPRGHPLAKKRAVRLRDLAGERLIVAPPGQRHRDLVGRALASVGAASAEHVEADGWPLMLAFAGAGLGVGVVNGICAPPAGVVLRPIPELGAVTYRVVRRRGAFASPACERLMERIVGLEPSVRAARRR